MNTPDEGRRPSVPGGELFRVIGIKPDRTRMLLADGLTHARAVHIRNLVLFSNALPDAVIEPDDDTSSDGSPAV